MQKLGEQHSSEQCPILGLGWAELNMLIIF